MLGQVARRHPPTYLARAKQVRGGSGVAKGKPRTTGPSKSSGLSWTMVNFWLDALMLVAFVIVVWSATIVRFVFPPAVAAKNWTLWSWNVDQWIGLHYATLCLFTFLVVVHLMLHWTWICGVLAARFMTRTGGKKRTIDDGTRTLWGVGLLIVILNLMGVAIAAAVLMIQGPH